jgi:hypothetical protein
MLLDEATMETFTVLIGITVTMYATVFPTQLPNAGVIK